MAIVALVGTLDTKGTEYGRLRDHLHRHGIETILIDTGVMGEPVVRPDITHAEVARAAGTDLVHLQGQDRGAAVAAMARGATNIALDLYAQGRLHGVLALGGSGGTSMASQVMRALPLGVPKLMVSSMASGNVAPYVGASDLTMMYSVVDIAGVNRISAPLLANAADAMAGMAEGFARAPRAVRAEDLLARGRPLVAASMAGVTTPGVDAARERLTQLGYEVLVFHTSGSGGRSLEALAAQGLFAGVLDLTLSELADDLVGGILTAGPDRLEAAGRAGVPQVVSLGALDMVKFGPLDTLPGEFRDRLVRVHNPSITVIRTTAPECAELGRRIAAKLRTATGPTAVLAPLRGLSTLGISSGPYHDPQADAALVAELCAGLSDSEVELQTFDTHINDPAFGRAAADRLHRMITAQSETAAATA
ncbi:Tm-1-like ATP-binding domain-containing protein [Streptomyces lunaelactis]|uniref:Tm-1-like ATP-binding domain-containing protein n=1 Tax=Streptomyces lunaelactis TaxID=1535768 RepID=UPI001584A5F8|nr:Tm-1-like ATP-binding domain-containing protein [Streptomyces lunaelactis]NUL02603.1 Tm-1-like ATP-binding domain-containing protein [Streptomyces lunaelactis]